MIYLGKVKVIIFLELMVAKCYHCGMTWNVYWYDNDNNYRGIQGVTVTVVGNGLSDLSSNTGQDCKHFT